MKLYHKIARKRDFGFLLKFLVELLQKAGVFPGQNTY